MWKYHPKVGERHGTRVIIQADGVPRINIHQRVIVRCDCGREQHVAYTDMRHHGCASCASVSFDYLPLIGQRVGSRTLTGYSDGRGSLQCDCGQIQSVDHDRLCVWRHGNANSCRSCSRKAKREALKPRKDDRRASIMAMKARGMKQVDIAKELGVTVSLISKIVRGQR